VVVDLIILTLAFDFLTHGRRKLAAVFNRPIRALIRHKNTEVDIKRIVTVTHESETVCILHNRLTNQS